MDLSELLTYSTVLIQCQYTDGTRGSGTGFIINLCNDQQKDVSIPVLITNNHVVENSIKTTFEFCKADEEGSPIDTRPVTFTCEGNSWIPHPDPSVDLRCLPLGPAINELKRLNNEIFYFPLSTELIATEKELSELIAIEEVIMIGYPIGLSDVYNHKPIVRRGITASDPKKNYQGKKEILVDLACFPGSSGSPVLILNQGSYATNKGVIIGNRIILLGVLYGGPQFTVKGTIQFTNLPNSPITVTQIPTNLGVMIKAERILEFEKIFQNIQGDK